uniref:NF-kappa-B inhibitor alpha n=1 Tax=Sinocyclocheilus anshuiensis TaxID=1608454 RepID=A0A671NRF7_9TELE
MDVHRAGTMNFQDCDMDEMDMKNRKMQHFEERVDSGVDSLKEDEYMKIVKEMEILRFEDPIANPKGTYLHLAIIQEAEDYAIQIIKQCQNDLFLNRQNNQRETALHLAVITDQPHMVDRLLKAGCDPRLVDQSGNTALHIACKRGSLACFSVLTQIQTQHLHSILSFPNYSGHTCLHIAAINNYLSMVESLVQLGADVNAKEQCSGRTSLHLAVDLQNLDLVHTLIALGADVNSLTYGGYTPYHLTFGRQNSEIQRQLYTRTAQELRAMPESESEESDEECFSDEDCMYDDIQFCGR